MGLRAQLQDGAPVISTLRAGVTAALAATMLAALSIGLPAHAQPADFDSYVLSLSWSPSFCMQERGGGQDQQCRSGRPYGFVVHGLWPQRDFGPPPDGCGRAPRIDDRLVRSMLDLMPSFGLVIHEWRRHGNCSGLAPEEYFAAVRRAYGHLRIPAEFRSVDRPRTLAPVEIEAAFVRDNPGLTRNAIAVTCRSGLLQEVRVCLSKNLEYRPCPEVDRRSCRAGRIEVPPIRGRW